MITLDYTFMTEPAVAGALSSADLSASVAAFEVAHDAVMREWKDGTLGFLDLPDDATQVRNCRALAQWARERGARDVVVLGIGGSALGPIALRTALLPTGWNTLSPSNRDGRPRLHVLDNVDPVTMSALLDRLELGATLFIVTSKSGGTAETMAQYLVVRDRLEQANRPVRDHIVFVTDPERGALRRIANAEGIAAVAIPPNVGGRFSVLTPVGLLPAAITGIDVTGLLDGAGDMRERCQASDFRRNPAGAFAVLQWLADQRGRHGQVFMPYSDGLRDMAAWFVQLWAESLGKVRPDGTSVGPTPIAALGATDQHSQVQLFMEGPFDKVVSFVSVDDFGTDITIPSRPGLPPDLAYLPGHTLGELLRAECAATSAALARMGRMNCTLRLPDLSPATIGELIMFFQLATGYAGAWYGINPFDQPGVELGKQLTYAAMGRAGYQAEPAAAASGTDEA